jgi:hypothetical protein
MSSEQEDEVQSLEAIYTEDFTLESPSSVRVAIKPSTGGVGGKVWVSCMLCVAFREGYPAVAAALSLQPSGLSESQVAELEGIVDSTASELLGTPVVYAVVERVREWLSERNEKPSDGSAFDEMMRVRRAAEAAAAGGGGGGSGGGGGALARELDPSIKKRVAAYVEEDEEVRRKRDGTPVTVESFLKWREGFELEMQKAREEAAERKRYGVLFCLAGEGWSNCCAPIPFSAGRQWSAPPPTLTPTHVPFAHTPNPLHSTSFFCFFVERKREVRQGHPLRLKKGSLGGSCLKRGQSLAQRLRAGQGRRRTWRTWTGGQPLQPLKKRRQ